MTDGSLTWVKSSYSGSQGGNCVEVAAGGQDAVLVRDTMNRGGVVLRFTEGRWQRFADSLKPATK
ncbi:MAG TPA: DUF397 domain-containing protein [Trebonia sp.]